MSWYKIAEFPLDTRLHELDSLLNQRGVVHRFIEQGNNQELWLYNSGDAEIVRDYFNLSGAAKPAVPEPGEDVAVTAASRDKQPPKLPPNASSAQRALHQWLTFSASPKKVPLTLLVIFAGFIGFGLTDSFYNAEILNQLSFQSWKYLVQTGEYWRLITPIFIHFGLSHIIFNGLWMWDLGKRVEVELGAGVLLLVIMATGAFSNWLQFVVSSNNNFGGLSGVVYGLLGYLAIFGYKHPILHLQMPRTLLVMMIAFLALGFTPIFEKLFGVRLANWAHLGGLAAGVVVALVHRLVGSANTVKSKER
jgi:Uncharacterized membrane protein (homolog of Drosophila rhomboid)